MFKSLTVTSMLLVMLSMTFSPAQSQQTATLQSSRRTTVREIQIEKEDIFDRLAPLMKSPVTATAAPEESIITDTPDERAPLIEVQPRSVPTAVGQPTTQPPARSPATAFPRSATESPSPASEPASPTAESSSRIAEFFPAQTDNAQPKSINHAEIQGKLTGLSQQELQALVRHSATVLSKELAGVHFGDRWQSYLQLDQLNTQLGGNDNASQVRLQTIVQSYDRIAHDKQFQIIADRHSFIVLHLGLAEYLAGSDNRADRQLAYQDINALRLALKPIPTGHHWEDFLQLETVSRLFTSPQTLSNDQFSKLQLILARFEKAAVDARFQGVKQLPGFEPTHRRLQAITAVIPDEETTDLAADEISPSVDASPAESPTVLLRAEHGLAFHRAANAQRWELANKTVALAPGSFVKTDDKGTALVVIGSNCQVICSSNTLLQVTHKVADDGKVTTELVSHTGNFRLVVSAAADLSPENAETRDAKTIAIFHKGHRILAGAGPLELDFQQDTRGDRVIAAVYAGSVAVKHGAGDELTIRAGREAVMLPAGIAVRAAAEKPANWWPGGRLQTADESGNGFSR